MQQGSIVIMVGNIDADDKLFLISHGISNWPEPSDRPLEVVELVKSNKLISGAGIGIDIYPELLQRGVYMDISLFREVLPPEPISIEGLIEEELVSH